MREEEAMTGGAMNEEGSGMKSSGERDAAAVDKDDDEDWGIEAVEGRVGKGRTSGGAVVERFRDTECCCCR